MNVQNRVGKRVEERRAHQPHESRKADEPDAPAQELLRLHDGRVYVWPQDADRLHAHDNTSHPCRR